MFFELKRKWFGPEGKSYEAKVGSSTVRHSGDEDLLAVLPSDATVFDKAGERLGTAGELRNMTVVGAKVPVASNNKAKAKALTDAKKILELANADLAEAKAAAEKVPDDEELQAAVNDAQAEVDEAAKALAALQKE